MPSRLAAPARRLLAVAALAALGGCAAPAIDDNLADARVAVHDRAGVDLRWNTSDEARERARADVDALLAQPLSADDAVRIAVTDAPAVQAALYRRAAESAEATQAGRPADPVLAFERLARGGPLSGVELTRSLTLPLVDLLALPARAEASALRQREIRAALAGDVLRAAAGAREAWIRAVAAREDVAQAGRVSTSADAAAELARRMEAAGNFSRLQRVREEASAADAAAARQRAVSAAAAAREALVRALGLDAARAARMQLPDRLPDPPAAMRDEPAWQAAALDGRVDVRLARATLERTAREQGLVRTAGWIDGLDLSGVHRTTTGETAQRGFGVEWRLPLYDGGAARRAEADATYQAALQRASATGLRAASEVRAAWDRYRSAWTLERHYRDEVVPLRRAISDENLLRYNGMQIGVFELLADARERAESVRQALDAQRDFWLADAALQAALAGVVPGASDAALD